MSRTSHDVTNLDTMSDRAVGGLHVHISKLLMGCMVAAIAATAALIITLAVGMPGAPPAPGPNGLPPPPPSFKPLAIFVVITGLFVLAWLAVIIVYVRDQVLQQVQEVHDPSELRRQVQDLLSGLRAELAADRQSELQVLNEHIAEFGEQRETDGYLNGMRVAAADEPVEPKVRSIRRPPPQR
jgi:hypothetical protein